MSVKISPVPPHKIDVNKAVASPRSPHQQSKWSGYVPPTSPKRVCAYPPAAFQPRPPMQPHFHKEMYSRRDVGQRLPPHPASQLHQLPTPRRRKCAAPPCQPGRPASHPIATRYLSSTVAGPQWYGRVRYVRNGAVKIRRNDTPGRKINTVYRTIRQRFQIVESVRPHDSASVATRAVPYRLHNAVPHAVPSRTAAAK